MVTLHTMFIPITILNKLPDNILVYYQNINKYHKVKR